MTTTSAATPDPPYYAVIFTSMRTEVDEGYDQMNERLYKLLENHSGFLGHESVRDETGAGVSVSYWKSLEDIQKWKQQRVHLVAQNYGKEKWYLHYKVRICKIEREYEFKR